ncbi:MAG: hypothetical protein ACJAYF_000139, partial [Arenicella sp.]
MMDVYLIVLIRAITSPDYDEEIDDHQWHFGLFLQQQWLQDQG